MSNQLSPQLKELIQSLLDEGYVLMHRGKYKFSDKFYQELTGVRQGLHQSSNGELMVVEPKLPLNIPVPVDDWPKRYMDFIRDAQVPARLDDNKGKPYYANKYSEDGLKAFRKALEKDNINLELLTKSTMLYYKSSIGYKKAIGNYMCNGDWRSDYHDLLNAAESGEEALKKHLKEETKNAGGYTQYRIG